MSDVVTESCHCFMIMKVAFFPNDLCRNNPVYDDTFAMTLVNWKLCKNQDRNIATEISELCLNDVFSWFYLLSRWPLGQQYSIDCTVCDVSIATQSA